MDTKSAAALMGQKGGAAKSEAKTAAVRENGKKGGRPRKANYTRQIQLTTDQARAVLDALNGDSTAEEAYDLASCLLVGEFVAEVPDGFIALGETPGGFWAMSKDALRAVIASDDD